MRARPKAADFQTAKDNILTCVICDYLSILLAANQWFFLFHFEKALLKVSFPRVLVTMATPVPHLVSALIRVSLGVGGVMFNVL